MIWETFLEYYEIRFCLCKCRSISFWNLWWASFHYLRDSLYSSWLWLFWAKRTLFLKYLNFISIDRWKFIDLHQSPTTCTGTAIKVLRTKKKELKIIWVFTLTSTTSVDESDVMRCFITGTHKKSRLINCRISLQLEFLVFVHSFTANSFFFFSI